MTHIDDIVQLVVQHVGVSHDHARQIVEIVIIALKERLPVLTLMLDDLVKGVEAKRSTSEVPAQPSERATNAPDDFLGSIGNILGSLDIEE